MPSTPSKPQEPKRLNRTKLKPVRFSEAELASVATFLGGRDFSAVVRGYVLGEPVRRRRSNPDEKTPPITCRLTLEFSAEEWAKVVGRLGSRDLSETVFAWLLGGEIPEPKQPARREVIRKQMTQGEAERVRQLAWIGNNLNQIARAVNQGAGASQVIGALISLERETRKISEHVG